MTHFIHIPHSKSKLAKLVKREVEAEKQLAAMPVATKLPPDPEEQNDDRAKWAETAILAFMVETGTDAGDALSDLLADLMHWCDRKGLDFAAEESRGREHYVAEIYPGPDPTPIG